MKKTSEEQDKTENLKTETRQKWDIGQKWDIIETETGQNQDKMGTVDKNETKTGILTLSRSTQIFYENHCCRQKESVAAWMVVQEPAVS